MNVRSTTPLAGSLCTRMNHAQALLDDAAVGAALLCRWDKLAFRSAEWPSEAHRRFLERNSHAVDVRYGHPIRNSNMAVLLTVVAPNKDALTFLGADPRLVTNYAEPALDVILESGRLKRDLRDLFDACFVQPWHGKQNVSRFEHGSCTGARRANRRFAWYADRPNKVTGDPDCLHIEGRIQGMPAVQRLGVDSTADLLTFDHAAYWTQQLTLWTVDLDRLGRTHRNRVSGQRRRSGRVEQFHSVAYSRDRSTGGLLFRYHGTDLEHLDESKQSAVSVQHFVDQYGRGPFLQRLDTSKFLPQSP